MDVRIDPDGVPTLEQPSDFSSFRLTGAAPPAEVRRTLEDGGLAFTSDGEHAYIEPDTIVRLAGAAAAAPGWADGLERMIAYADDKGWRDETGRIRVHAEWTA